MGLRVSRRTICVSRHVPKVTKKPATREVLRASISGTPIGESSKRKSRELRDTRALVIYVQSGSAE